MFESFNKLEFVWSMIRRSIVVAGDIKEPNLCTNPSNLESFNRKNNVFKNISSIIFPQIIPKTEKNRKDSLKKEEDDHKKPSQKYMSVGSGKLCSLLKLNRPTLSLFIRSFSCSTNIFPSAFGWTVKVKSTASTKKSNIYIFKTFKGKTDPVLTCVE